MLFAVSLCACQGPPGRGLTGSLKEMFEPMFPPTPSEVARDAFDMSSPDKRRRAIGLLSSATWGGNEDYVRLYRAAITDSDNTVRAAGISALGRHGVPEDAPRIARYLALDYPPYVRWEAAMALQKLHNPEVVRPLLQTLSDDEEIDVRMAAAKALGQYPQVPVYDALVGALNDQRFAVAYQAQQSLNLLTGQDFGLDAAQWTKWGDENGKTMFDGKQAYVWEPYNRPRGFFDKAQFWKKHETIPPRAPAGMTQSEQEPTPQS